jgi:hypothetical protein
MRSSFIAPVAARRDRGPAFLALGLLILLLANNMPAAPVVTGMSLVALGATCTFVARTSCSCRHRSMVAIHAAVYANLYVVFVGAVSHAAITGPHHGLSWLQVVDLVLSVFPMALVARLAIGTATGGGDALPR